MIDLRPVISVREIPPNAAQVRAALPTMRSLISDFPHADEAQLLHYLQQGVFGSWYPDPGLEHDVLHRGAKIDLSSFGDRPGLHPHCLLTDGQWLWSAALLYYVAQYHLRLDAEFVEHARANQWVILADRIVVRDLCWDAFENVIPDPVTK